jgi:urease accessory protein
MTRLISISIATLVALSGVAQAHTGHNVAAGFGHGFAHPFGGLDHLIAMVAVGVIAARLGGAARWALPLGFVSMMIAGGVFGLAGFQLPLVEAMILLSAAAFAVFALLRLRAPLLLALGVTGFFATFHGFAHMAEIPQAASSFGYAAGFVLATTSLHALGVVLGLLMNRKVSGQIN